MPEPIEKTLARITDDHARVRTEQRADKPSPMEIQALHGAGRPAWATKR